MKRTLHTNKGFTIVELIIAISLFLVLSSIILRQFVVNISSFKNQLTEATDNIYSISAVDNLGELLNEADPNSLKVDLNIITYSYKGLKREILIERNYSGEDNLVLKYYGELGNVLTKKYIIKKLNNFTAIEKGKSIYVNFENNKGCAYTKCLIKK
ncbi:MAG: type II secretion system protein J [Clostridiaceae bacterium]